MISRKFLLIGLLLVATSAFATDSPLSSCTHKVRIGVVGYMGSETLANVPVLVRISESISGFMYADCGVDGAGLVFCNEAETTILPHEIDEWNPGGESLVWVLLPELSAGTAFRMGWGGTAAAPDSHAVWSDYAGVWHMNEDSGTSFDSTANGLNAVPAVGKNGNAATLAEMVAFENGVCGRARVNDAVDRTSSALFGTGNHLSVPSYDSLALGSHFTISGWFHALSMTNDVTQRTSPRLFSRKDFYRSDNGWEIEVRNSPTTMVARGASNLYTTGDFTIPNITSNWVQIVAEYDGATIRCYANGVLAVSAAITPATDNGLPLAFGSDADGDEYNLCGQYDEIRLRGGTLSADRIRAEYDMIVDRSFLEFGTVAITANALSILAEGDLVEGVAIRLGGVPEGWTLHYTTDGSEPTAASPAYTVPFALAQSATVKALAVNDQAGWATDVAEQRFDLAPPLALTGARVRQRYPWNGLVDIDFTLAGDTSKCYRVSAVATDRGGGTNLAVRTVWEVGGSVTNSALDVTPGTHRFVWDAAADLPAGFVADRVAVSLRAESINDTALYMVVDLSGGPDAAHYPVSYLPDVPEDGWTDEYKTDKLVLRRVEPGTFTMGSPEGEIGRSVNPYNPGGHIYGIERLPKTVILSKPIYAGVFETTQCQWRNITGGNPSSELGECRPVGNVSYDMVRGNVLGSQWPTGKGIDDGSFLGLLSAKAERRRFEIPTDAQWEYICRAGTVTSLNNGYNLSSIITCEEADAVARYCGNSGWHHSFGEWGHWDGKGKFDDIAEVGAYDANAWGIYDCHGNVWEWCRDWSSARELETEQDPEGCETGTDRFLAGGARRLSSAEIRSGRRYFKPANYISIDIGVRLSIDDAPAVVEAPIVAPQNLAATSDRTDDVSLSWQPVSGAYAYQIWRSKTTDFADGTWLNTVTNTIYADWTAVPGTNYTYWVRAQFESGKVGRWSEAAGGRRAQ